MSAPQPAAWQREELVATFLDDREVLIPLREMQEDMMRRVLRAQERPVGRFLDLGAGDGATTELALDELPGAHAVLVDFSEPMLARAGARLARFPERWEPVRGDLSSAGWAREPPPGPYDAAVSSLAIHHLSAERKRGLFAELACLLAPGASFVNMDVVAVEGPLKGSFDERMLENLVNAERERGSARTPEQIERELTAKFDGEEDRPDTVEDQLRWLGQAGFEGVEVHFKWGEVAVFGGVKPQTGKD